MAYAESVANSVATANGYVEGTLGVDIDFAMNTGTFFTDVAVDLDKPHRNNFAAILGMPTWDVGVTATARATFQANGARGAMPLMFNAEAFPGAICNDAVETCTPKVYQLPGTGTESVPQDGTTFNWTVMCTANGNPCNADSDGVSDLIHGQGANTVIYLDDVIDPLNAGEHAALFNDLEGKVNLMFPVPIVTDDGAAVGWAYFKLVVDRRFARSRHHRILRLAGQRRGARRQWRAHQRHALHGRVLRPPDELALNPSSHTTAPGSARGRCTFSECRCRTTARWSRRPR